MSTKHTVRMKRDALFSKNINWNVKGWGVPTTYALNKWDANNNAASTIQKGFSEMSGGNQKVDFKKKDIVREPRHRVRLEVSDKNRDTARNLALAKLVRLLEKAHYGEYLPDEARSDLRNDEVRLQRLRTAHKHYVQGQILESKETASC